MKKGNPVLYKYQLGEDVVAFSSTRHGGCSEGHYASFNVNAFCGDRVANVTVNRKALCQCIGIADDHLIIPHQTHQTEIRPIAPDYFEWTEEERRQYLEGVDAVMTDMKDVCVGVSTADCIPIIIYDPVRKAVCAVHAGWRGTVKRIVRKAVGQMRLVYSSQPSDLMACIGPGISLKNFEVGDEVYEAFASADFEMEPISQKREKWHIDLPECNRRQLLAEGLLEANIQLSGICTYDQVDDFFSARRLGIDSGRIYHGIMMRKTTGA